MENMDKSGLNVLTKMGKKYPKCPKIHLPKLSAQAQKRLHRASVVRVDSDILL